MNRRHFLKASVAATLGMSFAPGSLLAASHCTASDSVLLTINLAGGPDFRYVFAPRYDSANQYSTTYWKARAGSHRINADDSAAHNARSDAYLQPLNPQHQYFGINPQCGWMKSMFDQGNVAVINNVFASGNRDHAHSMLMLESGNVEAAAIDTEQSGWGGRLANQCNQNVVSVSRGVRQFCYGPHQTDPLAHDNSRVVNATDTRKMGLYEFDNYDDGWKWNQRGYMSRALRSYYAAKSATLAKDSPYYQLIQHERSVRNFGALMKHSLDGNPLPEALTGLFEQGSQGQLNKPYFGKQISNIYDVMQTLDVLDTNIISAEYPGWDHHRQMQDKIEPALYDIFGSGQGLDTLYSLLGNAADKLIILVYGEFGRQLAANGDEGTDHGAANSMLLIGKPVSGGVYGDLFPESEINDDKYNAIGSDIEGLTSHLQIIGNLSEHLKPGSSDSVVPGWRQSKLESGVDLSRLFT